MESLPPQNLPDSPLSSHIFFPNLSSNLFPHNPNTPCHPSRSYMPSRFSNSSSSSKKQNEESVTDGSPVSNTNTVPNKENLQKNLILIKHNKPQNTMLKALVKKRKYKEIADQSPSPQSDFMSPSQTPPTIAQRYTFDQPRQSPPEVVLSPTWSEVHTPERTSSPQKKFEMIWNTHENEKQQKLVQLRSQNNGTENSRFANDFKILEVLGRGSFGKVYRCVNKVDQREYAVKETLRSFTGKYKIYGLNETQALASLTAIEDNTNVVRYYNSWIEDDKLYLVMEYCPSSLKEDRRQKGHYSEFEIRKVLRDTCLALSYLHRNNMVHLDVKPENILISKSQRYKLGDMGQSRVVRIGHGDIEEGDSRYVAPELINYEDDEENIDLTKADIFSLGLSVLELITNQDLPANGESWHLLRKDQIPHLDTLTNISKRLKDLIRRMLSKDLTKRPSAQELLNQELPSRMELELKWQRVENKLLNERKTELEEKLLHMRKRSRSQPRLI